MFTRKRHTSQPEAALRDADLYFKTGNLAQAEKICALLYEEFPRDANVINHYARVLQQQDKLDAAIPLFRQLVVLNPDLPIAHWNLAVALCEYGALDEGFAAYRRYAEITAHHHAQEALDIPAHQVRHDAEQRVHLLKHGLIPNTAQDISRWEECPRLAHATLAPQQSATTLNTEWHNLQPKITVIDNLLSDDALNQLRQYCWNSTIWRAPYQAGYLGAFPEHGMGTPLLAQIAEELRAAYPAIFATHPLLHFWGFKYDSTLSGIGLHADFAAVNVNFWITPDDANRDADSGGLIIWDKPAPLDWDFTRYNDNVTAARDYLTQHGATATKVPYRCNRAVIFDSNLFHETDTIHFHKGYLNRRINITLLYGRREVTA